jgi:ABC-type amino acid transport substrate-binding protein
VNKRISMAAMGCALLLLSSGCGGSGVASSGDSTSTVTTLEPGVLKVCLYPGFAPFAIKGDDGWSGWDPEYLAAFAEEQGLQFEPVEVGTFNDIWMRPGNDECDVAGTGITVTEARKQQTGTAIDWTDDYYSVARSLAVRKGTKITSVEDLAGQTVVTTKGATADIDLLARIAAAGLTDVKVEYVNDEAVGTRRVAEAGPDGPIGFAAGVGSIDTLAASIPGIEATWIHCMMLPDGTESSEPFAFTVRSGSTGVAAALNAFIAAPTTAYAGGPGSGLDCPK